jgi:hypothetical protein
VTALRVPAFIVIGGGAVGAGYVRQLLRAARKGRLVTERILVVDRDPACAALAYARDDPRVRLEACDWAGWLDAHLDEHGPDDQLVPYHWAPHLLAGWLETRLLRRGAQVDAGPPIPPRGIPYERATRDGGQALSYATWTCPPACIEPALCPHTRGPRDWSLAARLAQVAAADPFEEAIALPSLHLVFGVAAIPVGVIHAARDRMLAGLALGPRRYLVATASHCHGLAHSLAVSPAGSTSSTGAPG